MADRQYFRTALSELIRYGLPSIPNRLPVGFDNAFPLVFALSGDIGLVLTVWRDRTGDEGRDFDNLDFWHFLGVRPPWFGPPLV